jgi:hypothetical protein
MAVAEIAHKPDLTADNVREIFERGFDGVYAVEVLKGPMAVRRDFMVVKSAFVAVTVKLEQSAGATKIVYSGAAPRWWARLVLGLISWLLGFLLWNGLTREVREFIDSAPEFK